MLSIAIMGTGRMGTLIRRIAEDTRDQTGEPVFEVVAQIGFDLGELASAPTADAIIDFSNASCLDAVAGYVRRTGAALVSGTTGFSSEQMETVRELGDAAPVVWSGNYSIGVAALRHLAAQATRELPGFDIEIVECHHNQKVDAPSGTAKMLFDTVADAAAHPGDGESGHELHAVYGREGVCGARDPHEVGMHSLRGGTVAGVHTVSFFGPAEEVSLTHRAESREIFVRGALAATQKLVSKPRGYYTFDEIMFS